jgi:hypothetical protein
LLTMRKLLLCARGYIPHLGKFTVKDKRDKTDDDHKSKTVFREVFILML